MSKKDKRNLEERFRDWLVWWPWAHEIYVKYEEILVYLVVGVMTTIVSWSCKFLANFIFYGGVAEHTSVQTTILSLINWTSGVIFAYFTNRAYVFKSHGPMWPEAGKFVLSRVSTFFLDYVIMLVFDTMLGFNFYLVTIVSAVLVTVANYVFSKLMVFNKKNKDA